MSEGSGLGSRRILLVALVVGVAAVAVSAASASRTHSAATTFKIGWISGLTGSQATNSLSATQGLAAAVKVINRTHAAGKNIQFQIVTADDAATPQVASQRCNQLVNQSHVQAILGFESTPSTQACLQVSAPAKIPYILAQTATSGAICDPTYYSLATVGNQQVNPLIDYLTRHGSKKIYIVASDFASGHIGTGQVQDRVKQDGGTVVGNSYEPIGTTDFSSDISKIAAAKPDTVIDILVGLDEVGFYKQFRTDPRSNGIKTGSFLMDDAAAAAIGQKLMKNTVVNAGYSPVSTSKGNKQFLAALKAKYGSKAIVSGAAAAAWDGAWILAKTMVRAKTTSSSALIGALANAFYSGPRGDLSFKGKHYVSLASFLVSYDGTKSTIVGKFSRIYPIPANPACR
jgi:ABC-type branched-subunit amino acid transport system substrate-binding protein